MGCGGSKRLEPEGEAIPERLRPLLRRRYEEVRNKSRGIHIAPKGWKAASTMSKKELLGKVNASNEDIDVEMDADWRSESSEEGNVKVAPVGDHPKKAQEEGLVKAKVFELSSPLSTNADEHKVMGEIAAASSPGEADRNDEKGCVSNEQTSKRSKGGDLKEGLEPEEGDAEVQVLTLVCAASNIDAENLAKLPGPIPEDDDDVVVEEPKELGSTFRFKLLLFPPGSPSFRVYLNAPSIKGVEAHDNGNDVHSPRAAKEVETVTNSSSEKELQMKEDDKDTQVQSRSGTESNESVHSDEDKKRGWRGLRLKGKLPKPRTSGMKNLFKVQSCY